MDPNICPWGNIPRITKAAAVTSAIQVFCFGKHMIPPYISPKRASAPIFNDVSGIVFNLLYDKKRDLLRFKQYCLKSGKGLTSLKTYPFL